jgi:hypothetical protein
MTSRGNRIFALLLAVSLLLLLNGCSKKDIDGAVSDPFGKSIEGAEVQILKSQFKTMTNGSGKYSLDYVPGAFTVRFSKNGYTTHMLELNIQQKSKFPAELVTLYPMPKTRGFSLLGDSSLVELASKPVGEERQGVRSAYRMIDNQSGSSNQQGNTNVSVKQGKIVFVDTFPKPAKLFRLGNGNLLQEYVDSWLDRKFVYNGLLNNERVSKVGEENLLLRTVELEPGNYAWCGMVETFGGKVPHKELPCFPFTVVSAQPAKTQ